MCYTSELGNRIWTRLITWTFGGMMMATVDVPTELRVEYLMDSIKQLSPVELDEFSQKFTEWQQQQDQSPDEDLDLNASDDEVLDFIRKHTRLPKKDHRRYWELRLKREDTDLNDEESVEYENFITKLGKMNVKRIEALAILVQRWDKPAIEILSEHGLLISHHEPTPTNTRTCERIL